MNHLQSISWRWLMLVSLSPLIILFFLFELYKYPLSVPFGYQGDAYFSSFVVKHLVTQGLTYHDPLLGFPFGLQLYDFPFTDSSYFLMTFFFGLFTHSPFLIVNLHYLLSFVMIAVTAWWVWRQLGISPWYSWWGSLLYSFLPFHLIRGTYHLFLGNYWFVPFVIYFALWLSDRHIFPAPKYLGNTRAKSVALLLLATVTATSGIYYALFSVFLIMLGGGLALVRKADWKPVLVGAGMSLLIGIGLFVQLYPSINYSRLSGKNVAAGTRQAFEADTNSLSLMRLTMPLQDIGIEGMREHTFSPQRPLVDMEKKQFLGWGGLIGLVILMYYSLIRVPDLAKTRHVWQILFIFCLAITVLAMTGGVGTILAYVISPQIRAYGRILPFLAFVSLTSLLKWIDTRETISKTQLSRQLSFFGTLLMIGSLWSQVSWFRPSTPYHVDSFRSDREFFAQIDAFKPQAVYQLPYKAFPETPEIERISDYDLLKGYLHSEEPIAWSYASMKGRPGSDWLQSLSQFPLEVQIDVIRGVGFDGIYLDRFGWADHGAAIEASISGFLRQTPLVSKDERLVYYQL